MKNKLKAPEKVAGYSKLSEENKKLFNTFLNNFYKVWEYPEEHIPTRVSLEKNYLRVDFKDTWLHVKGPNTWY